MSNLVQKAIGSEAQQRSIAIQDLRSRISSAAAGPLGLWRLRRDFGSFELTGLTAGTYLLAPSGPLAASAAGSARAGFLYIDTYDTVAGTTAYMKFTTWLFCNTTAPLCNFTTAIKLAGVLTGAASPGIAVLGDGNTGAIQATITAPAAQSKSSAVSTVAGIDVPIPTNKTYFVPQVTISADMAPGAYCELFAYLEVRNV